MANYADSDAKTILTDVQLEVISLSKQIELLSARVSDMTSDLEFMTRAMDDFIKSMQEARELITNDVAEVSAKAFDEQLRRLEKSIDIAIGDRDSKRWRWWNFKK